MTPRIFTSLWLSVVRTETQSQKVFIWRQVPDQYRPKCRDLLTSCAEPLTLTLLAARVRARTSSYCRTACVVVTSWQRECPRTLKLTDYNFSVSQALSFLCLLCENNSRKGDWQCRRGQHQALHAWHSTRMRVGAALPHTPYNERQALVL